MELADVIVTKTDEARAEEMLDEIQKICAKYHAILIHKPDCMVVGFDQGYGRPHRAVAQVQQITPGSYNWRPVEWNPSKTTRPM